jgi:hypothetical protein
VSDVGVFDEAFELPAKLAEESMVASGRSDFVNWILFNVNSMIDRNLRAAVLDVEWSVVSEPD